MGSELSLQQQDYKQWLKELKQRFRRAQLKAAVSVNSELLQFYWGLGADIVEKQKTAAWGSGFLRQLSQDMRTEFPDVKGFSKRNLEQIRRWHLFWIQDETIAKQPASQLMQIPWWHNVVIVSKCQSTEEATYYVNNRLCHGWSRSVLTQSLPNKLKSSLPSIEQIEAELSWSHVDD